MMMDNELSLTRNHKKKMNNNIKSNTMKYVSLFSSRTEKCVQRKETRSIEFAFSKCLHSVLKSVDKILQ